MQREKIAKIIYFIKNNKLLVGILLFAFVLLVMLLFSTGNVAQENIDSRKYFNAEDYVPISESAEFIYYKDDTGYYVFVSDPSKTNKELIRKTLDIPEEIDFEIVLPNAFTRGKVEIDEETVVTPPPVDIDNPAAN